jgi:penicillin G amidase
MKILKAIVSLLLAGGLVYALNTKFGAIPPLGKFLSPFVGFWQNAESSLPIDLVYTEENLNIKGLQAEVKVYFDENRVPHIFAQNDHDAYMAQGYLQASERLFQLDLVSRSAGGRLAEVVGEKALDKDRYKRRMGSVFAAERSAEMMLKTPETKAMAEAYAEGINAYIAQLAPKDYPVEFKLLDYAPEAWTPMKSALLLKEMSFTLASGTDDLKMSNMLRTLGKAQMDDLFPDYPHLESPIIPDGTKPDFTPVPSPSIPANAHDVSTQTTAYLEREHNPAIGSNNWAVHGSRTATGLPILAGDPHLQLTLPSIWYQLQIHTPQLNTYGVALPGSPGVIIGFNENVAWSMTNTGSDVVDWYKIKFKDNTYNEYWYNGQWKKTNKRFETIKVRNQKEAVIDTVVYTHHGPVVFLEKEKDKNGYKQSVPTGYALRWIAFEASNELMTTYKLNRAKNYEDYKNALVAYGCPAQNFVFASNENDVAIWVNGQFPLKWKGQGKYLLDGSDPAHDWQGFIPQAHNPHVKNPARGFVSSANQFSINPKDYPYYLHWQYATANRGRRINERLTQMNKGVTSDSLRLLQYDNMNIDARTFLPELIKNINATALRPDQLVALKVLQSWNYKNDMDEVGPTIFEAWMPALKDMIWKDEFNSSDSLPLRYPSEYRTMQLIQQKPDAKWFDNVKTPSVIEKAPEIITASFGAAIDTLTAHNGPLNPVTWKWVKVKETQINHITGLLKPFSRTEVQIGGGGRIVNASSKVWGPSWKMVVELSKDGPKAKGLYPGGQSGNPGSKFYDNMIDSWAKGDLNDLLFMKDDKQLPKRIKSGMVLKGQ